MTVLNTAGGPSPALEPGEQTSIELRETIGLSQGQIVRKRFFHHKGAVISIVVLAFVIVLAFSSVGIHVWGFSTSGWWMWNWNATPPLINRGTPTLNLIPGEGFGIGPHPFGQDEIGKDIFALVMRGAQQSIMIMVLVGVVGTALGVLIGAIAGYYRGFADSVLMRITDVIITIPFLVIGAVVGRSVGGFGAVVLGIMLGFFAWTGLARLVRGEFLSLREREFVDAARVSGASDARIIFKHILPNSVGVIIVSATLLMAGAILAETALSYLGFGVQSPDTSLGVIVSQNQAAFGTRPWLFWWPGVFIIVIALTVNFIGDGLRDAFDPRQKKMPSPRALIKADARRVRASQRSK
ncbi:ABC transporter permease [Cryobacterium sp. CG_9.6]|uniref:ABC transporter permease n=1 Tax=Cryobacterium sp. CG_9.6 TaxID=2760710 RepID=UPI002473B536|nr:ABC transporter permease [Cryobacterium sp. CG_9.6]MDH6236140.1 peptide/nickel transport system permease protein [Cryobacterium sp. CG_9.6]